MVISRIRLYAVLFLGIVSVCVCFAQTPGSIRGSVFDQDFDAPLAAAQVLIAETGQKTLSSDAGTYLFEQVEPGTYTLVFAKEGYARQVKSNVVVWAGQMTEVDASLPGEYVEMEEFIVQDLQIGTGTEAALLDLRMESPALMDSVSAELMSQAGAGDAAAALRLVAGATIQDGKYAVVRGLPDRYVNSQMNSIRLPTADADKRAVQLDQFPTAAIESIQVSKTFTPDQQGDASGGAVNIVLKGIPDEATFKASASTSWNSNDPGDKFLSYKGGGVGIWGKEADSRKQQLSRLGQNWLGAAGVSQIDEPVDYKWGVSGGNKQDLSDNVRIGAFGSFFYEKDSSYKEGFEDSYWVERPGEKMKPRKSQIEGWDDFKTSLWDIKEGTKSVQWGGLAVGGLEIENHQFSITYMYTRNTEDTATLAENTRGKKSLHKYWPNLFGPEFDNYNPYDPNHPGNAEAPNASPYLRTETLEYTERTTDTIQFAGKHIFPNPEIHFGNFFSTLNPEIDWKVAFSSAGMDQPDKRMFGSRWDAFTQGGQVVGLHSPFKPSANFTMGYFQRVWKSITEKSDQYQTNLKLPFEQWSGDEGYLKFGIFNDKVTRKYDQDSFANFADNQTGPRKPWEFYWSSVFPNENHPITAGQVDVDYKGLQDISAVYYMVDVPLNNWFNIIGGTRFEKTDLSIINYPESQVFWYPRGSYTSVKLNPGDADVAYKQNDVLPSLGFLFKPFENANIRGVYSETVARQTFKELTPIMQMEYLGSDIFIGNPELKMSALKNYDLRFEYFPYKGSLFSVSWFYKKVEGPIEYVQRVTQSFDYTTAVNYPKGQLEGFEFELRQELAPLAAAFEGFSVGGNLTLIDSEVTLPKEESDRFNHPNVRAPMTKRDMTNAPEYLYNIFLQYDLEKYGTQLALFYTVRGDTLIAGASPGAGQTRVLIPSVYETEYGTLNFSISQKLGEIWKVRFTVKNILDPAIETVYRSKYIGKDVTKTSYHKGIEYSIGISAEF